MSETRIDERLQELLKERGYGLCLNCGKAIDRGDVAWNTASTGWTPYTVVEIQCQRCDTEAVNFHSWYPGVDDLSELLYVIESDLPPSTHTD